MVRLTLQHVISLARFCLFIAVKMMAVVLIDLPLNLIWAPFAVARAVKEIPGLVGIV